MEIFILDHGNKIIFMVKASIYSKMDKSTMESFIMARCKEKGFIFMTTGALTMMVLGEIT